MDSALFAIGQISVTIVGFAAVLKAFERENTTDAHTDPRIQSMVEQGLVLVVLCFLPSLFQFYNWSYDISIRLPGFLAAVWLTRWLYIMFIIRKAELSSSIATMFLTAVVLHYAAFFAFLFAAFNLKNQSEAFYFTGILLTFVCVGWAFLAQFKIERNG